MSLAGTMFDVSMLRSYLSSGSAHYLTVCYLTPSLSGSLFIDASQGIIAMKLHQNNDYQQGRCFVLTLGSALSSARYRFSYNSSKSKKQICVSICVIYIYLNQSLYWILLFSIKAFQIILRFSAIKYLISIK